MAVIAAAAMSAVRVADVYWSTRRLPLLAPRLMRIGVNRAPGAVEAML
jgi:hypothetical protein